MSNIEKNESRSKRTKIAIIVLAVLSGLALIGVIIILAVETTKKNIPKNVKSICFVIVDNGKKRTDLQIESINKFVKFECSILIVSTAYGTEMQDETNVNNLQRLTLNETKSSLEIFFYFIQNSIQNFDGSHWIFLGDNVIIQNYVSKGDFFIDQNIKFFNLTQVDSVLFNISETPESPPSCLIENIPYPFLTNLLDLKIDFGTRVDLVYAPTINQFKLFTKNKNLNYSIREIKATKKEKFSSFFVALNVLDFTVKEEIESFITNCMKDAISN